MSIQFFLTAWDPSDLPGSSVDPLGFDRAYGALADLWLPGLTNVANRPRYFAILCAGAVLADVSAAQTPREERMARLETILRLERLWCLAHALVENAEGIRGVRYVEAQAARLKAKEATETTLDFPVLSHQGRYGVVGIYGAVATGLRLMEPGTLRPTPDLGARLGNVFRKHSKMPAAVLEGARHGTKVPLRALSDWMARGHIAGDVDDDEAACYREALSLHPLRARATEVLRELPARDDESELAHLARVARKLRASGRDPDLGDALEAIAALEDGYRLLLLVFERLVWRCATATQGALLPADLAVDPVIIEAGAATRAVRDRFTRALDAPATPHLATAMARLASSHPKSTVMAKY